jgi:hypothetical protein
MKVKTEANGSACLKFASIKAGFLFKKPVYFVILHVRVSYSGKEMQ